MFTDLRNTDSVIYQMAKKVNKLRKQFKLYDEDFVERKVLPNLYVYSRGQVLVALTNSVNDVVAEVSDLPFAVGDVVCNLFDEKDCLVVGEQGVQIHMLGGKAMSWARTVHMSLQCGQLKV